MVSRYPHQEDVERNSPDTNLDPIVQEAFSLMKDEGLRRDLFSVLPNEGQSLEDICQVGFAQYQKNAHTLAEFLRDESS